jgi:hypothetical protein
LEQQEEEDHAHRPYIAREIRGCKAPNDATTCTRPIVAISLEWCNVISLAYLLNLETIQKNFYEQATQTPYSCRRPAEFHEGCADNSLHPYTDSTCEK